MTTDYTVTINANGTGSVTLVLTAGTSNITIVGAKNIQRTTDFTTGGDLFANTLNDELDNQTIFIQQVAETAERALKAPVTDPTDIAMTLPAKTDRASKYLGFDSNGNPVATSGTGTTVVSTAMEPVVSAATLAAGRTNFGLGTISTQAASAVAITGGSITGITDLAIADGGTGASTAENARINLGVDNYGMLKNRIINGAMVFDQRNAGASGTGANNYTVDRWAYFGTQASKGTWQQNAGAVTPPTGFTNYLGFTSSSAYSVLASDLFEFYQFIEGYNIADLGFGTANAKTITVSFWVRSSLTGTFGGGLINDGSTRNYPFTYTISSANTWEFKTVTVAGDITGTWLTNNGKGVGVVLNLGAGSDFSTTGNAWNGTTNKLAATGAKSVVETNGATFYITGVQLEKGTQATSFEYRQYTTELSLCQRYLPAWIGTRGVQAQGQAVSGTLVYIPLQHPVQARTAPTGITSTSTNTIVSNSSGSGVAVTALAFVQASNMSTLVSATVSSGLTAGNASFLIFNDGNLFLTGCEL